MRNPTDRIGDSSFNRQVSSARSEGTPIASISGVLRPLLALTLLGLAAIAFAGTDERSTPCEWYGAADAVFIGEAGALVQRWVQSAGDHSPLVPMKFSP